MAKLKNSIKGIFICVMAIFVTIFFSACNSYYFDKLGGGTSTDVNITSVDTDSLEESMSSAVDTCYNAISTEQKNTTTPSEYSSATYADSTYTISSAGSYLFSGEISSVVKIESGAGDVHIYLNSASFTVSGKKVINSSTTGNLIITLIGDNSINNYVSGKENNAISTSGNLTINGTGTLTITSCKSGIKCDSVFYGLGGTVNISASNHGISADTIVLDGMTVNVTASGKDGLHAESDYDSVTEAPTFSYEKGFIYITGSSVVKISGCYGDGIQVDSFVYIAGGTINISTVADFESYQAQSNNESGCYSKSGSTYSKVATDKVKKGTTYYKLSQSCKGIKAGEIDYAYSTDTETKYDVESTNYAIYITGGDIDISSTDDGIHANSGTVLIGGDSATIDITTSDDGIHADYYLVIAGGTNTISSCYEGFEAQSIEIAGGTNKIVASDDGINAANSNLSEEKQKTACYILISDGTTYVCASGDGVDSNGRIKIAGGTLFVSGPTSDGDASIDAGEGCSLVITGGTVIAVGAKGMVETPATASTQCSISININGNTYAYGKVTVTNSSGSTIATFDISSIFGSSAATKKYQSIVISSPSMQVGSKYTVKTASGYSKTITQSSIVTTSGNSAGGKMP